MLGPQPRRLPAYICCVVSRSLRGRTRDLDGLTDSHVTSQPNSKGSAPTRVFLCHASADRASVRRLYDQLVRNGFLPWLAEEDLLPGEDWARAISDAVRGADFVVVCLSAASTNTAGYVQKEIKLALDVADYQPDGSIFVIPARLEECELPQRLMHLHRVDLFADGGFSRLTRALRYERATPFSKSLPASVPPSSVIANIEDAPQQRQRIGPETPDWQATHSTERTTDARSCSFSTSPVPPECFVGRSAQVRQVLGNALSTNPPLVSLVGPSKIGRTSFLRRLADIARSRGQGTDLQEYFDPRHRLIAPYVDLGGRRANMTIRETIARAFADEMMIHGLVDVPSPKDLMGPAAMDRLACAMSELGESTAYLLLVDQAEHMLVGEAVLAEDPWAGGAAATIGVLSEAVKSLGVVLAFGTRGPASKLDVNRRQHLEHELLLTISALLDRVSDRIELGLLEHSDVVEFARRVVVRGPGTPDSQLSDDEVQWLARIAGGHPFVLHRAGSLAWMMKTADPLTRRTPRGVEEELIRNLAPLVGLAMRRVSGTSGALDAAADLAEHAGGHDLPREVARALVGEGLVAAGGAVDGVTAHCTIPSPAIRAAVRNELGRRDQPTTTRESSAVRTQPPYTLATQDAHGRLRSIRVTPVEHQLLEKLMSAEPGSVTSHDDLQMIDETRRHVVQRLSVLRMKIRDELGLNQVIENVYGRGYRFVDAHLFRLRGP